MLKEEKITPPPELKNKIMNYIISGQWARSILENI